MATTTTAVERPAWQEIAKTAQDYRDSTLNLNPPVPEVPADLPLDVTAIPKTLLSPEAVAITQTPPEELVKSLALGRLTSLTVTTAFLQRAGVAQKLVCLSGPLLLAMLIKKRSIVSQSYSLNEPLLEPNI